MLLPFFAPTEEERAFVFNLHLNNAIKKGFKVSKDVDTKELAKKTNKYTQAEIEDIALKECNDQEFIPEEYKERHRQLMSDTTGEYGEVNRIANNR